MYLDRKEFALHTSAHDAVHYAGEGDKESTKRTKEPKKRKTIRGRIDNAVSSGKSKTYLKVQKTQRSIKKAARGGRTSYNVAEDNEFSDHSDVEYFERLPESVFRAIEDTQDSQRNSDDPLTLNISEDTEHNETMYAQAHENSESPPPAVKKQKRQRECPICSKVYTTSSSYYNHLNSHRQSEHECNVCGKILGSKGSLANHAAVHSTERRFECTECRKKFRSRASLYIHVESHGDTKNFACDQCDSAFRWRTHLLRHLKRHSAEKTHVCSTCGRGFSVRCDLLRHSRTHRAGSHACEKCNRKFAQRRYLKVHMMNQHSIAISGSEIKPE